MPAEAKFDKAHKTDVHGNDCLALSDEERDSLSDQSSGIEPIFDPIESIRPHSLAHAELGFSETIGKQLKACEQLKYGKRQLIKDTASVAKEFENKVAHKSAAKLNWDFKSNQFSNLVSLESPSGVSLPKQRMNKQLDTLQNVNLSKTTNHIEPDIMMFYSDSLQRETPSLPSIPKMKFESVKVPTETINDIAERLRHQDISCQSIHQNSHLS